MGPEMKDALDLKSGFSNYLLVRYTDLAVCHQGISRRGIYLGFEAGAPREKDAKDSLPSHV